MRIFVGLAILALIAVLYFVWREDKRWHEAHKRQCAEWLDQATTASDRLNVELTCAKLVSDQQTRAAIAAAAGAVAASSASRR